MNRRELFKVLLVTPIVAGIKPAPIPGTWGDITRSTYPWWNPHPKQLEFLYGGDRVLWQGGYGQWLHNPHLSKKAINELLDLIVKMEKNRREIT